MSEENKKNERLENFPYTIDVPTRWGDYDILNHLNNVSYYRFFEIIVVSFIEQIGELDWLVDQVVPFAAESKCYYLRPLAYQETVRAGLAVETMGNRSATYKLALFGGASETPAALGYFVHVFVDRNTSRPVPIPDKTRQGFLRYLK